MTSLRVTVEIRAGTQRIWRLSDEIAPDVLSFGATIPHERGERVRVRFRLPGGARIDTEAVVTGERALSLSPAPEKRVLIEAYVREQAETL